LSSLDEEERKSGIEATRRTIAWAERLQAKVVVIHLGRVMMDRSLYDKIKQLLAADGENSPEHLDAVREFKQERKRLAGPFFDAARRTLDEILACLPKGIRLGIESRYEYFAIPTLEEMARLLNEYPDVGYWHDLGHAFVQETMGFYERGEYIRTLQHGLIGFHIHDSLKISDHRAPGYGEIDFDSLLKPYLRDDLLKVLEFHPRVPPEEAADGIRFLRDRGII